MNYFNEDEFLKICSQLKKDPIVKDVTIEYTGDSYFNKVKEVLEKDRRGEVVFCVERTNGKYVIVTCKEYPNNIYRIPTGGICHDENIIQAVYRETMEELGVKTEIKDFAGVLKIKFKYKDDYVMFYSYLFIMKELSGKMLEDASDDEISEIREVDVEEIEEVAKTLLNINGKWNDWGRFRYETTHAVYEFLNSN